MHIRFWEDPETGLPHVYGHAVTETEVREVLLRPGEDVRGDETSRIKTGRLWLAATYRSCIRLMKVARVYLLLPHLS